MKFGDLKTAKQLDKPLDSDMTEEERKALKQLLGGKQDDTRKSNDK